MDQLNQLKLIMTRNGLQLHCSLTKFVFVPTFGNEFGPFVYDRVTGLNDVKFLGET